MNTYLKQDGPLNLDAGKLYWIKFTETVFILQCDLSTL